MQRNRVVVIGLAVLCAATLALAQAPTQNWTAPPYWSAPAGHQVHRTLGAVAAENALTGKGRRIDRSSLPHAIFTTPQVASVGLTEAQARAAGIAVKCRSVSLEGSSRAMMTGDTRGLVKIVAGEPGGRVLGVHICAPLAAEIIGQGVLAVKHGLTVQDLVDTFPVFPTIAGAIQDCARAFRS